MSKLNIDNLVYSHCEAITLELVGGDCICVSGHSGCGKTLFLRALVDMYPHSGDVALNGRKMSDFHAPEWRRKVALLPSESAWWYDNVGDHFGFFDKVLFGEFGFESDVMSWDISRMSSGEKQRLALLRILQNSPEVLLLDEATANIDRKNSLKVESFILDYSQRNTVPVIWVSHDREQRLRLSEKRYVIEDGIFKMEEEAL